MVLLRLEPSAKKRGSAKGQCAPGERKYTRTPKLQTTPRVPSSQLLVDGLVLDEVTRLVVGEALLDLRLVRVRVRVRLRVKVGLGLGLGLAVRVRVRVRVRFGLELRVRA